MPVIVCTSDHHDCCTKFFHSIGVRTTPQTCSHCSSSGCGHPCVRLIDGYTAVKAVGVVVVVVVVVLLLVLAMSVRIVKQYENGVLFRLGRVIGEREPGLRLIIPLVDVLHRISLRIVTMPIQSQGIITRDNVSVDVSAVAYFKVVDAVKSVVAIENVVLGDRSDRPNHTAQSGRSAHAG